MTNEEVSDTGFAQNSDDQDKNKNFGCLRVFMGLESKS
jgi:hypothetical protein